MTRPRLPPPLTAADLHRDGPDIRLRDIIAITGKSRTVILAAVARGDLVGYQVVKRKGSPWCFDRRDVAGWWGRVRYSRAS